MDSTEFHNIIQSLLADEPRYAELAYRFVADAVGFTVERLAAHRHVSARELLEGIRDYSQKEYGVLAPDVLSQWGLHSAEDIGNVVYLMIGAGLLSASPEDDPRDFRIEFSLAGESGHTVALPKLPIID